MGWQKVAAFSDLRDESVIGVHVGETPIALYKLSGEVYATHGICTHALAILADGWVEDGKIECPLHQGLFDIRTGKALCEPLSKDLRTYAVKVEDGEIFLDLDRTAAAGAANAPARDVGCEPIVGDAPIGDQAPSRVVIGGAGQAVVAADDNDLAEPRSADMTDHPPLSSLKRYAWPAEGLTRIPDWVYTDPAIYEREIERIFHGPTWNFVALECEVPKPGDFIRSNVGPTPVVVSRAADGSINVFENRCSHRAAEFCRALKGNVSEFVCPYHQWSYDLKGNLAGIPFRRGVAGKGGLPASFKAADHSPTRLRVTTHRGVVFASYSDDVEALPDYMGPDVLREFEATFDGRPLKLLGYYRHTLPGNWKLYHENLRDPYHGTLLHAFLVTFGLFVAGNKFMMFMDPTGRHGVMASARSDGKTVAADNRKEMRAYQENLTLADPRLMDFVPEFDSPWSVTMATIWPNLIVQREMNTLGIRHIVPTGPHEFIMKWTMFGFEGDDEDMTRHRLRQGNLMGPAGFLGIEDNEAIKFVQDGMQRIPNKEHLVMLDPDVAAGSTESVISEAAIRAMYKHWRAEMGV